MLTPVKKIVIPLVHTWGKWYERRKFTDEPILIGGCGRSGTTLLLSILSSHPRVFACRKELSLFKYVKTNNDGTLEPLRLDRLYTSFLRYPVPSEASRWCEKTPNNVRHIDRIDSFFQGKFKFIHLVRDGRDVVLSKHPSSKDAYYIDPERWVNDTASGLRYREHPNVLTIKYEDLVLRFEETITAVCDHLDLEIRGEIMDWYKFSTVRKNPAYFTELKNIHKNSVGKWKHTRDSERIGQLLELPGARKLLAELDYL